MLNKIILFSIKNKLIIGLLLVLLIVWGAFSLKQLPIDAVPDITNNQVQIITNAPSQAAADIERLVTFPIEQAVATIPEIEEVRSFSRFGLSVITVVFKENTDIYWARQQVSERLSDVRSDLPPSVGQPKMAPVTTGLGEIYQYVLHPKEGYSKNFSTSDLRTIQDWIVRRQLLGVKGVADISSFGGHLKQYEVAINTDKLRSINTTIQEVIDALRRNNSNTGGAYIDSKPNAYFIRTEGFAQSIDDINNIVVKNRPDGLPILIKDVATVQEGHAIRYGALTYMANGEAVGGIVMMLKGANSSEVIANVKDRIAQIQKTLPEGVEVVPFLDRTKLVNNAIGTVSKNLIEGALIVILVLVLLLGNFRAGLIVASVIPLAMLFAFGLMNIFGVSGNLMSLGAIDFGIIVDGAVIIVEATIHHLSRNKALKKLTQQQMDTEVYESASKIRNSAAFGEIIILIVYLPLLALTGIEGKMFRPMAQTVSFAILGAFILSLTYVPMMSALFLSKKPNHKTTISDRIITRIQNWYTPLINKALNRSKVIVAVAFTLFIGSILLFTRLGAEFIPSLDEGDFAVEVRLMPGSSLAETVDQTNKASQILLDAYPNEVDKVVGKIGSSEIPTDPMPIEACDLMVILKPKKQWTKASSKDELIQKMTHSLEQIPGMSVSFQQPIQMRFNELMTGAKQDVVVKIYGESLDLLTEYAKQVSAIVSNIDGAKDIYEEQATGLTQIVVDYDRDAIARLGLNIDDLNNMVNTSFAGYHAGQIFEEEKRFDLVVRLEENARGNIDDIKNLLVTTPNGQQLPLYQIANVSYQDGPNQIQRDDAKRRIMVGFNVRGRDVESVVKELEAKIGQKVTFAPGYYAKYGGTFENLQQAKSRLSVAVPIALFLIFILLYFTFRSIKQGLMIYTAIPLSAIGGIIALWLRGMPFSISAAVGFIALFGVAVLNGIVLIAEFNRLKADGNTDLKDIILQGTRTRLRPVIMTASVASLGFLPMALSHGSGAEVQKPLATVVIGGLVSATILTLFVLPCIYYLTERMSKPKAPKIVSALLILIVISIGQTANAQTYTLEQLIDTAKKNNYGIKAQDANVKHYQQLQKAAFELPKTQLNLMYGQYNSYVSNDNNYTVSQQVPFPTLLFSKRSLADAQRTGASYQKAQSVNELVFNIKQVYYELKYLYAVQSILNELDTTYQYFAHAAELRYKTGESTLLEQSTAQMMQQEVTNQLVRIEADIEIAKRKLKALLSSTNAINIDNTPLVALAYDLSNTESISNNPLLKTVQQDANIALQQKRVAQHSILPDINIGYFNQTMIGTPMNGSASAPLADGSNRFTGFQVGLHIPLWIGPQLAKVKAEEANRNSMMLRYRNEEKMLQGLYDQSLQDLIKQKKSLDYYKQHALKNAELVKTQSQKAYKAGEIGYTEYLIHLQQVQNVKQQYLKILNDHNQAVIRMNYLNGNDVQ